jgi:ABC-type uncharacterized transport system substrate-binding protein
MRRREFINCLGGGILLWPRVCDAQKQLPVIGFLFGGAPGPGSPALPSFRRGLQEAGYVEGESVSIEFRSAKGEYDRLPELAAELVRRQVSVIVAAGGGNATTHAAKAATSTIPIVFLGAGDPVEAGLVESYSRPGANLTGVTLFNVGLDGKRVELLHELVPERAVIAVLVNPNNPNAESQLKSARAVAALYGLQVSVLRAGADREFEQSFATLLRERARGLVVMADAFFYSRLEHLVALAARHAVPAVYDEREYAEAGGLMSYGPSIAETYHQLGLYTGRILKGERPADLPVMQPTKPELVINLKTAETLGLTISPAVLARADEVIE